MKTPKIKGLKFSYFLSFAVLIWSNLFLYQNIEVKAVTDITPPLVSITSPTNNLYVNSNTLSISGTVSDDISLTTQIISMKMYESISDPWTFSANSDGTWNFTTDFIPGTHTVTVEATDGAGNTSSPQTITFTVDVKRPYISEINVTVSNQVTQAAESINLLTLGKMTRVLLDTKITLTLNDDYPIDTPDIASPFTLFSNKGTVDGTTVFNSVTQQLEFSPSTNLSPSTTYFLMVNPKLIDSNNSGSIITDNAGNSLFPKIITFTTTSISGIEDPHGNYTTNTNTCINCHSTHVAASTTLDKPNNADNYCMACHDGTVAPLPENMDADHAFTHDNLVDPNKLTKAGSCTQCHNPHVNWSKDNPSRMKDHFIYNHTDVQIGVKDSQTELCENCHDTNTNVIKDTAGVDYKVYHYRNSLNATGILDDYDACLRCHNGEKAGIKNINGYYSDSSSKHRLSALDGSLLIRTSESSSDGHIPCADCHETHGSRNIMQLKEKLGHENQNGNFSLTTGSWDTGKEREFCMKCHNGSTAIYGIKGANYDETRIEHNANTDKGCSYCHGGTGTDEEKSLRAAHDPQTGVIPTP